MALEALAYKCLFDYGRECGCLVEKNCTRCKFRKTKAEFENAQQEADDMLQSKGLMRVKKWHDGQFIITAEKECY